MRKAQNRSKLYARPPVISSGLQWADDDNVKTLVNFYLLVKLLRLQFLTNFREKCDTHFPTFNKDRLFKC